jgi:hypothetical protein
MTALRQRLLEDLQLRGYSAGTQQLYVRAVRQLAAHYGKSPADITEEELRQYFLYLMQEHQVLLRVHLATAVADLGLGAARASAQAARGPQGRRRAAGAGAGAQAGLSGLPQYDLRLWVTRLGRALPAGGRHG